MTKAVRVEKFKNGLGETRYRFVVPSILHPGRESRSVNSWRSRSGAWKATAEWRRIYKATHRREAP
jgi:hypothetical protein